MFYDNYVKLCNSVNKTPSAVALEIGLSKPTVNRWKNGGGATDATAAKVADYFGVSVEELISDQKEKNPTPEGVELTEDQVRAIEKIKKLPPEELAKKMAALEAVLDM